HRLIKKGPMFRFGPDRPEHGSPLIIWPMALVVMQPSVALENFRISERGLVTQANPACDQCNEKSACVYLTPFSAG
ncbi:MAG TPA: hypothetical protein VE779_13625, partial [Candidatus Angelobacter sp.]|nr:hypothetical protein [Candidatus Angelobacter sp.]